MTQRVQVRDPSPRELSRRYDREGPIPVDEATYVRLALEDRETHWELHDGLLVEKPSMSFVHGGALIWLRDELIRQLDRTMYLVFAESGRLRRSSRNYLIPDVAVTPAETFRRYLQTHPDRLGVFDEPMPLVAEIWSPSTGNYDIEEKIPQYIRRGDLEIWRLHPRDALLTSWRQQSDGSYARNTYQGVKIQLLAIPEIVINLEDLFV